MNILITGANGFVGSHIYKHFETLTDHAYYGLGRRVGSFVDCVADLTYPSDVADMASVLPKIDWIIHTAGIAGPSDCEKNTDACLSANVDATSNLLEAFPGARMVYFSTYAVYNTQQGNCDETCETNPTNAYVATKILAEAIVSKISDKHIIIRPSVMFGYSDLGRPNYLMTLLATTKDGGILSSPRTQFFNPIHVDVVCDIVARSIDAGLSGTFNIGSNEAVSKYSFNSMVMEHLGIPLSQLKGISTDTDGVKRPKMATITSKKVLTALDYDMPSLDAMIRKL